MGTINFLQDYRLYDFFTNSNKIIIYKNGNKKTFEKGSNAYNQITNEFLHTINNAHEMPAFGVSIHEQTSEALKTGLWIKFEFETEQTHNEMPFKALLINIMPDYKGFNLIREYENRYEGRCFYLDLDNNDMSILYEIVLKSYDK